MITTKDKDNVKADDQPCKKEVLPVKPETHPGKKKILTSKKKVPHVFGTNGGSDNATVLSKIETVVTNIYSKTLVFGFLPPHGKELASGESVTIAGDLEAQLKTGGGRNWQRKVDAYNNAITDNLIRVVRNVRHIVYCAVDTGTVIAVGDLLYLDTDDVKPAASFTWTSNIATTQANFANVFLGVALASHAGGSGAVTNFPVDMSPLTIYKYACTSEAHEIGDTLGLAKDSGNNMVNQSFVKAAASSSVARCHKRDASAATSVQVTLQSAYWGFNAAGSQ